MTSESKELMLAGPHADPGAYNHSPDNPIENQIDKLSGDRRAKYSRFFASAALGSIPWIGGVLAVALALQGEAGQEKLDETQRLWLHEHEQKIKILNQAIGSILERLRSLGDEIMQRIESSEYLDLVRKTFAAWDRADTEEKRDLLGKLLSNAGGTRLCSDDIVRLFIEWIDHYNEIHFKVIREVYQNPGVTRAAIWEAIHGEQPRDDSAEADLFKLLINDLTLGYVIRQHRDTTAAGQFLAVRKSGRGRRPASPVLKSPFDDEKPYELTELGKQFVHYTMDEIVPRVGGAGPVASA